MVPEMPKDIARASARVRKIILPIACAAIGLSQSNPASAATIVSEKEKTCLATAIYFEARSESEEGQRGVAQVILNRVENDAYPDTICSVVYQNQHRRNACQFSFACDGKPDRTTERKAWQKAQTIAEEVLDGDNLVQSIRTATHYHATYVNPSWAPKLTRLSRIGRHVFYRT